MSLGLDRDISMEPHNETHTACPLVCGDIYMNVVDPTIVHPHHTRNSPLLLLSTVGLFVGVSWGTKGEELG